MKNKIKTKLLSVNFGNKVDEIIARCRQDATIAGRRYTLYVPSGDMKYPAFWPRDAFWIFQSGKVPLVELKGFVGLTAETQADANRQLANGLFVPANAIPDHITFDGKPVFSLAHIRLETTRETAITDFSRLTTTSTCLSKWRTSMSYRAVSISS
jgi:hypothetical protein